MTLFQIFQLVQAVIAIYAIAYVISALSSSAWLDRHFLGIWTRFSFRESLVVLGIFILFYCAAYGLVGWLPKFSIDEFGETEYYRVPLQFTLALLALFYTEKFHQLVARAKRQPLDSALCDSLLLALTNRSPRNAVDEKLRTALIEDALTALEGRLSEPREVQSYRDELRAKVTSYLR